MSIKTAECISKIGGSLWEAGRLEAMCKPLCSLGKDSQQVKGRVGRSEQSRTATAWVGGAEKWVTVTAWGGHMCFSSEVMGPQGVVNWFYKPCFLHTLSPSQCVTRWHPSLCTAVGMQQILTRTYPVDTEPKYPLSSQLDSSLEVSLSPTGHSVPQDGAPSSPGSRLVTPCLC